MKLFNHALVFCIAIIFSSFINAFDSITQDTIAEQQRLLDAAKKQKEKKSVNAASGNDYTGHLAFALRSIPETSFGSSSSSSSSSSPAGHVLGTFEYNKEDLALAQQRIQEKIGSPLPNESDSDEDDSVAVALVAAHVAAEKANKAAEHRIVTFYAAPLEGMRDPKVILTQSYPLNTGIGSLRVLIAEKLGQHFPNRLVRFRGTTPTRDRQMPIEADDKAEAAVTVGDLPTHEVVQPFYHDGVYAGLEKAKAADLIIELSTQDLDHQLKRISESLAAAHAAKAAGETTPATALATASSPSSAAATSSSVSAQSISTAGTTSPASAAPSPSGTPSPRPSKIVKPKSIAMRPTYPKLHFPSKHGRTPSPFDDLPVDDQPD